MKASLKLYEIADDYLFALEALTENDDFTEEEVEDTMEGLRGSFDQKAIAVAAYIRTIKDECRAVSDEKIRLNKRALMVGAREEKLLATIKRLTEYLKSQMERCMVTEINGEIFTVKIKNNPPRVEIDNLSEIPAPFKSVTSEIQPLKEAIKKALLDGKDVPGAHLEQSTRLDIA